MYKRFFILLFVCFVTSDVKIFTFDPDETILSECIRLQMIKIDNLARVADNSAYLAARRFHGKSISSVIFSRRFKDFFKQLRQNKVRHAINKEEITEGLRVALKQALIDCAIDSPVSPKDVAALQTKKLKEQTIRNDDQISFSLDELSLSECIHSHLKLMKRPEFYSGDGFVEEIADFSARRYYGKTMRRKNFYNRNRKFFYDLRNKKIFHEMKISSLSAEVESSVEQALEDCAMDKEPLVAVPTFRQEPIEIANILNLLLVKWPENIQHMIQSRNGRRTLRRYASDALIAVVQGLNVCQNSSEIFRLTLRSFWRMRAQEMYNAYSEDLPYVEHRYTLNYPTPHMIQSIFQKFRHRKNISFRDRNPLLPLSYLYRIINICSSDDKYTETIMGIFEHYRNNGITHAEYYFENRINKMYRIIFFFLELCARQICNDEDDIFNGPLPDGLVPEQIQVIIDDDDVYRDYILDERSFYEMLIDSNSKNEISQNLLKYARIIEKSILIKSNIPSNSGIQSATTLKTTISTTESLKRKDDVWKNKNGKCFPKRRKISNMTATNDSDINHFDQVTKLPLQRNHSNTNDFFTVPDETDVLQELNEFVNKYLFDTLCYGYITSNDEF